MDNIFQFEVDEVYKKDADKFTKAFMLQKNTRLQDISRILYEFCSLFPTNMVKQEEKQQQISFRLFNLLVERCHREKVNSVGGQGESSIGIASMKLT